jgi:hypothetical protein
MNPPVAASTLCCCLLLGLSSCAARYDVVLERDGSADVGLSASLGVRTAALITNLSGAAPDTPILDAGAASKALASSAGSVSAALTNPDRRSLEGTVSVGTFDRFLSSRFVSVEAAASGGKVSVFLDRASAPEVLASLSPEVADYLSALMAPIATGEALTGAEYLSLVASVYGTGVSGEIRDSAVAVSLALPGTAVSVSGGSVSGGKAVFSVPLLDLLTLERPVFLEASWR